MSKCEYCGAEGHTTAQCQCTRPTDWKPGQPARRVPLPESAPAADDRELAIRLYKQAQLNAYAGSDTGWNIIQTPTVGEVTIEFLRLCRAHFQPAPTSGWVMVPRKITEDMVVAFMEAWVCKRRATDDPEMQDAYSDMLAAAPLPPTGDR